MSMSREEQMDVLGERLGRLLEGFCAEFDVTPLALVWLLQMQAQVILGDVMEEIEVEPGGDDGDDGDDGDGRNGRKTEAYRLR